MIDRSHDLPIARQAKALGLPCSTVYYMPRPVSAENLKLMRRLDELPLDHPFVGGADAPGGYGAGARRPPRHVVALMKRMGIEAVYRRS